MKAKQILIVLLLSSVAYSCTTGNNNEKTEDEITKPNFIFIMADDLGYGGISCYGNKTINTPNLDKMATEGIRFTDFHSNGAVCSPTRAALMTGKYQQRTGVNGVITAANHRHTGLSLDEITIAEELKKYGYTSGIFGKWHLGYPKEHNPSLQGFDEFKGYVSGNVDYHAHIDQEGYPDWWRDTTLITEEGYTTDLITKYGIDFIKKNKDKPFFLYLPHEAPHAPYQGRNDNVVRKAGVSKTRVPGADSLPDIYKEMVEVMDEGIGNIFSTLKETGLDKNTIVIFCSDNGANKYGDNGGLNGNKGSVYEGGHRVPAIAWYPGKFDAGIISEQAVLTMDILPTMLDIIGESPGGENIDGISVKDHLFSGKELPERDLFWSAPGKDAVRSGGWKLVSIRRKGNHRIQLFNIEEDVSEKNNLFDEYPEKVEQLQKKLEEWKKEVKTGVKIVSGK
ncbi:MAG: sulfatase [Bacteroidota bacterium]